MNMKKVLLSCFLICMFIVMSNQNVKAQEFYYQNEFGVELTEQEYNFYTEMYWDGYQNYVTKEDYNNLLSINIFDKDIEKKTFVNYQISRSASVTSNSRTLSIAKSCSTNCVISLVNTWNGKPSVKSYDVFGVRLNGVSLVSKNNALVTGSDYSKSYSANKTFDNGFGYSILVPNVDNVKATVTFITTKGGTIYGSYQHAVNQITESTSKQYTIGAGGYGGVFKFTGSAKNVYDSAPGVDISV